MKLPAATCALWIALAAALPQLARAERVLELRLATPPHAPADAPDVMVHVPSRFDPTRPVELLIFLHGFSSCARALLASEPTPCTRGAVAQRPYGLAAIHERASANSLLVVPQLAFLQRVAGSPRFARAGGFDAFLDDLLGQLAGSLGSAPALHSVTLLAHSAGYRAAAQILRTPSARAIPGILVLFDALYANWDIFARWLRASPDHRLISLHTRDPATRQGNAQLERSLGRAAAVAAGDPTGQSLSAQLLVAEVQTPHRLVPERHLAPVLRSLFVTRDVRDAAPEATRPNASAR